MLSPALPIRSLDLNGDGVEDLVLATSRLALHLGNRADVLIKVNAGLGDATTIKYGPLPRLIEQDAICSDKSGVECGRRGIQVVTNVERHTNVPGAQRSMRYEFGQPWTDFVNGKFLGFGTMVELDEQSGARTTTRFEQRGLNVTEDGALRFPYAQLPTSTEVETPIGNGHTLRTSTVIKWTDPAAIDKYRPPYSGAFQPLAMHVEAVTTEESPEGVKLLRHSESTRDYDQYGNMSSDVTEFPLSGDKLSVSRTWKPEPWTWLVAQPDTITTESTVAGKTKRRQVKLVPDPLSGLVTQQIVEPGGSVDVMTQTDLVYDSFGNLVAQTVMDATGVKRRTNYEYDATDHTLPTRVVDPMGHVSETVYHPGLGLVAETKDANGVRWKLRYDGFGVLRQALAPRCDEPDLTGTGCSGASTYFDQIASSVAGAAYAIRISQLGRPTKTTHYDVLGRAIRTEVVGFDGKPVTTLTTYDPLLLSRPKVIFPRFRLTIDRMSPSLGTL